MRISVFAVSQAVLPACGRSTYPSMVGQRRSCATRKLRHGSRRDAARAGLASHRHRLPPAWLSAEVRRSMPTRSPFSRGLHPGPPPMHHRSELPRCGRRETADRIRALLRSRRGCTSRIPWHAIASSPIPRGSGAGRSTRTRWQAPGPRLGECVRTRGWRPDEGSEPHKKVGVLRRTVKRPRRRARDTAAPRRSRSRQSPTRTP